jgi:hypothetical protein
MKYFFWTKSDEIPVIQKVLDKYCLSPLQEEIKRLTSLAHEQYTIFKSDVDTNSNRAMPKLRKELARIYQMLKEVETDATDTEGKTAMVEAIDELEDMSKKAHEKAGFIYAPLQLL